MDPDLEDSNNHIPPVAPADDWGVLDVLPVTPVPGLPSARSDHGIPPRKTAMKPLVNRHATKLNVHGKSNSSPADAGIEGQEEDGESPEKFENWLAEQKEAAAGGAASKTGGADDEGGEAVRSVSLVPQAQGGNRQRVNEIGNFGEAGTERTARMYPMSDAEAVEKAIQAAAMPRAFFSRGLQGEWADEREVESFRWMFYTGIGVIALVVITVVFNHRFAGENIREQSMFSKMIPDEIHKDIRSEDGEMIAMLTDGQKEAKRIFAKYVAARSSADFIGSVHRAEEMAGLIERRWEPLGVKPGWHPGDRVAWTVLEQEGVRYGVLEGVLPDFRSYRAFFRQEQEGLKMDWKATSGYSSSPIGTLKEGQGDGSEVRVWLSPTDFHTFPLPEGEFRSFRLTSPDGQENLWGYTKKGGELDGKLIAEFIPSQITGEAKTEVAVIVGLEHGPTEALPNQWMITRLVRLSWLDE